MKQTKHVQLIGTSAAIKGRKGEIERVACSDAQRRKHKQERRAQRGRRPRD
jgi:hypothetical protein